MSREIFQTLHIEIKKNIEDEKITDDIITILQQHGYACVAGIGITHFNGDENIKDPAAVIHKALKEHCDDIKDW